jgi:hypothetical protein
MQNPNANQVSSTNQPLTSASDDVLHIPSARKLTAEEIAKAVAHHNKHRKDKPDKAAPGMKSGKKPK